MTANWVNTIRRQTWKPREQADIHVWAEANINVGSWSPWPGKFSTNQTPWIVEPMRAFRNPLCHRITIVAAAAGGKSTVGEVCISWLIPNDPGFTCWFSQTEAEAKRFSETRLMQFLAACPEVVNLLPQKSDKVRNMEIIFPHMSFLVLPANESSAQSKHIRYLFCDETWLYEPGILAQLHKRTTKFSHNRKIVEFSTGSIEGDETHQAWLDGTRREWQFRCSKCDQLHVPQIETSDLELPGGVRWSQKAKLPDGSWDMKAARDSVRYQCPRCHHLFEPTSANGYALNKNGEFTAAVDGSSEAHESFHWSAVVSDFKLIPDFAVELIQAKQALRRGTSVLLQEFVQKRCADAWVDRSADAEIADLESDYNMGDPWPDEVVRFMTVDVQKNGFWCVVRGWTDAGETLSRLHFAGELMSWRDVRDLQQRMQVEDRFTFVDSSAFTDHVYRKCCLYGWVALKGEICPSGFTEEDDDGKIRVPVIESNSAGVPLSLEPGSVQRECTLLRISEGMTSDSLHLFRTRTAPGWTIPRDTPKCHREQMAARIRRGVTHQKSGRVTYEWVTVGRCGEHLWDCERYQLAAAYLAGILDFSTKE